MIEVTLPLPPPLNQTYKTGKGNFYKSDKVKAWITEAGWEIKKQLKKYKPIKKPTCLTMTVYYKREVDIDAHLKSTLDLLEKMQIVENDKLIVQLNVNKFQTPKNPRLELIIEELL